MKNKKVSIVNDGSRFTMMTGAVTDIKVTKMGVMYEVTFDVPRGEIKSSLFFERELQAV